MIHHTVAFLLSGSAINITSIFLLRGRNHIKLRSFSSDFFFNQLIYSLRFTLWTFVNIFWSNLNDSSVVKIAAILDSPSRKLKYSQSINQSLKFHRSNGHSVSVIRMYKMTKQTIWHYFDVIISSLRTKIHLLFSRFEMNMYDR